MTGLLPRVPVTEPSRVVAYTDVVVCDRDHEVTLYTDGVTAYAHGAATDCPSLNREGHYVQVVCGQPLRGTPGIEPDPCEEVVIFDLLTDDCWVTDRAVLDTLDTYGERIIP